MKLAILDDKKRIESYLRQNTYLHLYEIGDLDDFFWPDTQWFGLEEDGKILQIIMLYRGSSCPTLLGFSDGDPGPIRNLILKAIPDLPEKMYCHLSVGLSDIFSKRYNPKFHGLHHKMSLTNPPILSQAPKMEGRVLTKDDLSLINDLYEISYPGNWFVIRMLETGYYYGIIRENKLVCIAGVHVFSGEYKVATLGNVTTHPDYRNQGLGKIICSELCQDLMKKVDHIGLNVKADNKSAISVYTKIGFTLSAEYEEYFMSS